MDNEFQFDNDIRSGGYYNFSFRLIDEDGKVAIPWDEELVENLDYEDRDLL